jgi:hypothetical protein
MTEVLADRRLPLELRAPLETLTSALLKGECLLFLGAGAAVDTAQEDLPTGAELSQKLAEACELEWHRYIPLSTTAFYYESFFSRYSLNEFLKREIDRDDLKPSASVEAVVELVSLLENRGQQVFVVTTNYDHMFERAYEERVHRKPHVIVYRGAEDPNRSDVKLYSGIGGLPPDIWRPTAKGTYLYKMHGCTSDLNGSSPGVVITEEDYVNFLSNTMHYDPKKGILSEARGKFALSMILFVGYSLTDWNFRVIFKATAESVRQRPSYALQYFTGDGDEPKRQRERQRWDASVRFWAQKGITVINHDACSFIRQLITRVSAAP